MHDRSVKDRKVIARRSSKFTVAARDEKVTVTFPGRHLLAAVPCPLVRDSLSRPPHRNELSRSRGKREKEEERKREREERSGGRMIGSFLEIAGRS